MAVADPQTFAGLLRRARRDAGLTQPELAERAGLSMHSVSNLERGAPHVPRDETVRLLAHALALVPADEAALLAAAQAARRRSRAEKTAPSPATSLKAPLRAPVPPTSLIGREELVVRASELLRGGEVRLLTLVGMGGVGKTHLALEIARRVEDAFPGGVAFVALAPLRDAGLVPGAIARVLGVTDDGTQPLIERIAVTLGERAPLLLLDNVEHLLPEAAEIIAGLLTTCPDLRVLATGRAPLHIRGEHEVSVPPLALPDPAWLRSSRALGASQGPQPLDSPGADALDTLALDTLAQVPAVALFVERAGAACPDFRLTPANAAAVATICARLDGLPLALELAAPRLRFFPPNALLARLEAHRFPVLTGGPKDLQTHQQTLRSTLDWSYALLAPKEQALLRRLAIFAGGASLEAIAEVCDLDAAGDSLLLDGLSVLVDHSLAYREVTPTRHEVEHEAGDEEGALLRVQMLETIREYAWELLSETGSDQASDGEVARLQEAHARYFQALVATAEAHWRGPEQPRWLARLEQELENLRVAFRWAAYCGDALVGLRLTAPLWQFWVATGRYSEGRAWLEQMLALSEESPAEVHEVGDGSDRTGGTDGVSAPEPRAVMALRATAFNGVGALATLMGDYEAALAHHERALALRRTLGDAKDIASSLNNLGGVALERGDYPRARALWEESLAVRRRTGEPRLIAVAIMNLGMLAYYQGDYPRARAALEDCLPRFRELGDPTMLARTLNSLGSACIGCGDLERATRVVDESLAIARSLGYQRDIAFALYNQARIARLQGDHQQAVACCQDAQRIHEQVGDRPLLAQILALRGGLALDVAGYAEAEQLLAQSLQMREALHSTQGCADVLAELGHLARERGRWRQALEWYREALRRYREVESTANVAACLEGCASILVYQGQASFAVRLLGAAAALRDDDPSLRVPREQAAFEQTMRQARDQLGAELMAASWEVRACVPLARVIADVIAGITQSDT